jgi:hypothetical protein
LGLADLEGIDHFWHKDTVSQPNTVISEISNEGSKKNGPSPVNTVFHSNLTKENDNNMEASFTSSVHQFFQFWFDPVIKG